jgi:hypothetical protein
MGGLFNRIRVVRLVDDALVACAVRSYCHVVDRGAMHRVTAKKAAS